MAVGVFAVRTWYQSGIRDAEYIEGSTCEH